VSVGEDLEQGGLAHHVEAYDADLEHNFLSALLVESRL
jgi:hypothetical protein